MNGSLLRLQGDFVPLSSCAAKWQPRMRRRPRSNIRWPTGHSEEASPNLHRSRTQTLRLRVSADGEGVTDEIAASHSARHSVSPPVPLTSASVATGTQRNRSLKSSEPPIQSILAGPRQSVALPTLFEFAPSNTTQPFRARDLPRFSAKVAVKTG